MRRLLSLAPMILACSLGWAQTPTLVQHVSCPNSGAMGSGVGGPVSNTAVYQCPLPEPSQSGNALVLGLFAGKSSSTNWTISDDKSNTWTQAGNTTDSNGNFVAVYYALNVAAGTRFISAQNGTTSGNGYIAFSASEYYNVAQAGALDAKSCNAGGNSSSITAGSITPATSGDLLWQWAADINSTAVSSFSSGSQSNISWQLNGTDIDDGDATQAGVYSSTAAINPTFSSGTAAAFDSCAMTLKSASAGTASTQAFRIVHMLHEQMTASASVPYPIEMPTSGNLVVISFISGGNTITSINSNPSNNWASTGGAIGSNTQAVSQIYYAANASPSNTMSLSISQTGSLTGTTFMMYDITGAASSPFDVDSGGQSGDQKSTVSSLTSCSNCLTPTSANELIIGNIGNAWCTATGISAPSGGLFDVATFTGNSVNGPESVDQNNGWFHDYDSNTSPITVTWNYICGTEAENAWVGRVAAFKGGSSKQPLPATGLTGSVVPQ